MDSSASGLNAAMYGCPREGGLRREQHLQESAPSAKARCGVTQSGPILGLRYARSAIFATEPANLRAKAEASMITNAHIDDEVAAVTRMAALKCRNCYGDELLMRNGEGDSPCPDCRDAQGQPTGRRFPGLVKPCPKVFALPKHQNWRGVKCWQCDGSMWMSVAPAEAMYWLMRQEPFHSLVQHPSGDYSVGWCAPVGGRFSVIGVGSTPLLAVAAAIDAADAAMANRT